MADYTATQWVDEQTPLSAANFNNLEAGVKDAVQNAKQRGPIANRPAASAATKNWLWTDSTTGQLSYCDGVTWTVVGAAAGTAYTVAVADTNVNIAAPGDTFDGIQYRTGVVQAQPSGGNGSPLLLIGQTDPTQNGLYTWTGAANALTRRLTDGAQYVEGMTIPVVAGVRHGGSSITYTAKTNPTLGTDALTFRAAYWIEPWHLVGAAGEPGFLNSWRNFDAANQTGAGFRKDSNGRVFLKGLVTGGAFNNGTQGNSAIFQLPSGYRPTTNVHMGTASYSTAAIFGAIRVNGIGQPNASEGMVDPIPGGSTWLSLDALNFSTDE